MEPLQLAPFSFARDVEEEYRYNGLAAAELSVLFDIELDSYVAFPRAQVQHRKQPKHN